MQVIALDQVVALAGAGFGRNSAQQIVFAYSGGTQASEFGN
jgi:hypothetical protein